MINLVNLYQKLKIKLNNNIINNKNKIRSLIYKIINLVNLYQKLKIKINNNIINNKNKIRSLIYKIII